MKIINGEIFSDNIINFSDAICITTNGNIKKDGKNVMGAGIALLAKNRFKDIDIKLGNLIKTNGHVVQIIIIEPKPLVSFPTKYNYWDKSSVKLIEKSLIELVNLTDKMGWKKVILPKPGCNNGGSSWSRIIKPLVEQILNQSMVQVFLVQAI
jgi:hypothetical protein